MCLYACTHAHTQPHWDMYEGWSVCGTRCLAGFTCHLSVCHRSWREGPHPPPSTCQRGGMTGDKAGVTDSDRAVIPSVRHGQGAASPCVTLSDRAESCARGGMMQLLDRGPVHDAGCFSDSLTHMHTNDCRNKRTRVNAPSHKHK